MNFNNIAEALGHPDFIFVDLTKKECDDVPFHHKRITFQGVNYIGLDKPVTALSSKLLVPPADYVKPVPVVPPVV